ncbi:MAG: glutamate--tRNA ligase [Eubacteriales bacterium]
MIRVRFAPSPTGYVHIGSLRTALYNYLFAKNMQGKYILRIEDTDQTRYVEGSIENLIHCLMSTGIIHDEGSFITDNRLIEKGDFGPYTQSKRLALYQEYIQQLIEQNWAYYCFCSKERLSEVRDRQKEKGETPKYDGHCRALSKEEIQQKLDTGIPYVIRLKLPEEYNITFEDVVRGNIQMNTQDLDDQILMKSDGFPTYHFAVVIDDHLMGITHIIRGEEWLPSTPKHVLLYQAFGWEEPKYVHLPNILNEDKKKLSKRQGDVAVEDFLNKGYLPEALVNYIALLGWSPDSSEEIFDMESLIQHFDLTRVNKSGAVFDRDKLNWMNAIYIKNLDSDVLMEKITPYLTESDYISKHQVEEDPDLIKMIAETFKEKLSRLSDIIPLINDLYKEGMEFDEDMLEILHGENIPLLTEALIHEISDLNEITPENLKVIFKRIQKEKGIKGKDLYMPARIITTGEMHGSDLMKTLSILGKERVLRRIRQFKEARFS